MTDIETISDVVVAAVRAATGPLLERIAMLEARALVPGPAGPAGPQGERGTAGERGADGAAGRDGRDGVQGLQGERGKDGADGLHGKDGIDGKDGLNGTLESVSFKQLSARAGQWVRADGSVVPGDVTLDASEYRGVYVAGTTYDKGDRATHGGSEWVARDRTTSLPGTDKTWQLAAKCGRDGRAGEKGERGLPGPKGDRGEAGRNYQ